MRSARRPGRLYGRRMERQSTEARTAEIQHRVEAWVKKTVTGAEATGTVGAQADASRAISLPGAPGETVPEEWNVAVQLRFSGADEAEARRLLEGFSGATATVTLESREAAEITWPDTKGVKLAKDGDDLVGDVTVTFGIPWPHESDAASPAM
jgi:hypothetical protein